MVRLQNTRGMSLIELLVAVAILLVGIIPLLALFLQGLQTLEKSNKMVIANNLARDLSEEIRSRAFWDPTFAYDPVQRDTYFPNTTVPQPFGFSGTYNTASARIAQLDYVDAYNGWCRGVNCDCTGKPAGLCQTNAPLETYDGKKYGVDAGYPALPGFTRSVSVFNIIPTSKDIVYPNFTTHLVKITLPNTTSMTPFRFYNLQDSQLLNPAIRGVPGRTYVKVIQVTVTYQGHVVPYIRVDDVSTTGISLGR
jgi:prepilin-type N-terminal cleavage/methylation domain-containing protein